MHAKDGILGVYKMADRVLEGYLADLSDADLLVRPVPGQNHIAWQLGHLITSEKGMLDGVKAGSSPELDPEFVATHGRDETATTSDDPSKFSTKDEYLALYKAQREATLKVLHELSDEEMDAPAPERMRGRVPTMGGVMNLVGLHVLMHAGQFVSVRRALKKPIAI